MIVDEPELHLGGDVVAPTSPAGVASGCRSSPNAPYLTLAPDWICEVLSPSTSRVDRAEKLPIYAHKRVRHAWLVDPLARTLEVLRLDDETSSPPLRTRVSRLPVTSSTLTARTRAACET